MNYYQHHIGDFNNATRHLTRVERNVYRESIELYYDTELPLILDISKLNRKLLCVNQEEKDALLTILSEFYEKTEGGFYHHRCESEIEKYRSYTSSRAKAGIASAAAKKLKKQLMLNTTSTRVEHNENIPLRQRQLTINHKPLTNNQYKDYFISLHNLPEFAKQIKKIPKRKPAEKDLIPYQAIVDLFNEIMVSNPSVQTLTEARKDLIRGRWNDTTKTVAARHNLEYWAKVFRYMNDSDWLTGKVKPNEGKKPFLATFDWIFNVNNYAKIVEGNYANKG